MMPQGQRADQELDMVNAPLWRYPEIADMMVERAHESDPLTHTDALLLLLSFPIKVAVRANPATTLVPITIVEQQGITPESFIDGMASFYYEGVADWDPSALVHVMLPPSSRGTPAEAQWAPVIDTVLGHM